MTQHYNWSGGIARGGGYLETPHLWLGQGEKKLPPIDKADHIEVNYVPQNNDYEKSEIYITWITKDERAILKTRCALKDERLKKQFRENPAFLDEFLDFLQEYQKNPEKENQTLTLKKIVALSDIPDDFREEAKQIKVWDDFLKPYREDVCSNQLSFLNYKAHISKNGYYLFLIRSENLKLSKIGFPFNCNDLVFDFDPETEPPEVDEYAAIWTLEDKKICVVLLHKDTIRDVVNYYGYQEEFQKFKENRKTEQERQRQEQKEFEEASEKRRAEEEEEAKKKKEEAHKKLLS